MENNNNNAAANANASFSKLVDPTSNKIFNVEKVKGQKIPDHFFASKDVKTILVNGQKIKFMRNAERTQYVAFEVEGVKYYIRDHSVVDCKKLETYVKPVKAAKVSSLKKADLLELLKLHVKSPEVLAAAGITIEQTK